MEIDTCMDMPLTSIFFHWPGHPSPLVKLISATFVQPGSIVFTSTSSSGFPYYACAVTTTTDPIVTATNTVVIHFILQ